MKIDLNFCPKSQKVTRCVVVSLVVLLVAGESLVGLASGVDPYGDADRRAASAGFVKRDLNAGGFALRSYGRIQNTGKPITFYIEGDGLAWKRRNQPASDPTPLHPLVLSLAALDPSDNIVYLARPGQYVRGSKVPPCDPGYWTDRRFAEEVIQAMNEAVQTWLLESASKQVHLVGYSGGGTVAVLIAARRNDIAGIRTIAGNLDPTEVNRWHKVSPLAPGPDPIAAAAKLKGVPQRHFVGAQDTIVIPAIAERYRKASGDSPCVNVTQVDGASHSRGWFERWTRLLAMPVECAAS